jgi:hypothetical protein
MTQEPPKRNGNVQLNLNTLLLTICVGLSGWALYSINQLDQRVAAMMQMINGNSSAISDINKFDGKQSEKIEDILNRLTKLETIQADHLIKN